MCGLIKLVIFHLRAIERERERGGEIEIERERDREIKRER